MSNDQTPGFLQTFIGSLTNVKDYPRLAQRSNLSMLGHYALLIVFCSVLYSGVSTVWFHSTVVPFLDDVSIEVPHMTIKDGKAYTEVEQPYQIDFEEEAFIIIDTTQAPEVYLEKPGPIVIVSENSFTTRDNEGKINTHPFNFDMELGPNTIPDGIAKVKTWFPPVIFLLCLFWQIGWKFIQVLATTVLVTLIQGSRPNFGTHWRLANLALGPAMAFGIVIYSMRLYGAAIPGAGFVFWTILIGLTYYGSQKLRETPNYS